MVAYPLQGRAWLIYMRTSDTQGKLIPAPSDLGIRTNMRASISISTKHPSNADDDLIDLLNGMLCKDPCKRITMNEIKV